MSERDEKKERLDKFSDFLVQKYREWTMGKNAPPAVKGSIASQADFALYLGIDPTALSYFINGRRYCSEESATKIANRLGSRVYDLLGYNRKLPDDPILRKIMDEAEDADQQGRREILDLIAARKGKKETIASA